MTMMRLIEDWGYFGTPEYNRRYDKALKMWALDGYGLVNLLRPFFGERFEEVRYLINKYRPYNFDDMMVACDWLIDQGREQESDEIRDFLTTYSEPVYEHVPL